MIGASASRAAALGTATAELRAAGIDAPRRDARLLMQHALGLSPEALLADDGLPLGEDEAGRLKALVHRRAAREPIAYLTGGREFWSLEFAVDRSALVPRPESETLVEAVLDRAPAPPRAPAAAGPRHGHGLPAGRAPERASRCGRARYRCQRLCRLAGAGQRAPPRSRRAGLLRGCRLGRSARRSLRCRGEQSALCGDARVGIARAGDRPPRAAEGARRWGRRVRMLPATRAANCATPGIRRTGRNRAWCGDGG